MIYINHSFHNGFFHRVFDGSTAPRMRAQYPHLSHKYDHGVPRELPWGHYTVFGSSPGLPGKPTKAPQVDDVVSRPVTPEIHLLSLTIFAQEALVTLICMNLSVSYPNLYELK